MLPESVVLHVVPEQLEGLLLFPALQDRRGGRRGEGEEGEGRGRRGCRRKGGEGVVGGKGEKGL